MTTQTQVRELIQLEKDFWDAMQRKDGPATQRLTGRGCIVTGPQGVATIEPDTMSQMVQQEQWSIRDYSLDDKTVQVRMLDDNTAVVAYSVKEKLQVEGETVDIEAHDSSVWQRENGQWKCALHTESISGDPFGRDRRR